MVLSFPLILNLLIKTIDLYLLLLMVRVLLTWFPNISWYNQPFKVLYQATEPVLAKARAIIPPLGMMDLSPLAVFFALQLLQRLLESVLAGLPSS
jgi:YggT family protein